MVFAAGARRLQQGPQRNRPALEGQRLREHRQHNRRLRKRVHGQEVSAGRHGMVGGGVAAIALLFTRNISRPFPFDTTLTDCSPFVIVMPVDNTQLYCSIRLSSKCPIAWQINHQIICHTNSISTFLRDSLIHHSLYICVYDSE